MSTIDVVCVWEATQAHECCELQGHSTQKMHVMLWGKRRVGWCRLGRLLLRIADRILLSGVATDPVRPGFRPEEDRHCGVLLQGGLRHPQGEWERAIHLGDRLEIALQRFKTWLCMNASLRSI